jgi:pimeloyl-ACP methyl ester carboxylesterase
VSYLRGHGVTRIGAFGLSTGGEVVLQAAAEDTRIGAVVADGAQGRSAKENNLLHGGVQKGLIMGTLVPVEAAYRVLTLESPPPSLAKLVPRIAPRPVLLIATSPYEREINRIYARRSSATVYEIRDAGHTQGLERHPSEYAARVLGTFDRLLTE